MPKEKVDIALRVSRTENTSVSLSHFDDLFLFQEAKQHGCRNVLALRGDPPAGKEEWEAVDGGFVYGIDLVRHIRQEYGDYFDIAVAGFPQYQLLPPEQRDLEMQYLKEKIDAGVNFIFTQMFYDVDIFIEWVKAVREAGITVPLCPESCYPDLERFLRATSLAKTKIPQLFLDAIEPHKNDDEKGQRDWNKTSSRSLSTNIEGTHWNPRPSFLHHEFGERNKDATRGTKLGSRVETIKPLPWRQVCHVGQHTFVAATNIYQSLTRPDAPRQFVRSSGQQGEVVPFAYGELGRISNGRFGDSRSPAYGELDGYGVWIKQTVS